MLAGWLAAWTKKKFFFVLNANAPNINTPHKYAILIRWNDEKFVHYSDFTTFTSSIEFPWISVQEIARAEHEIYRLAIWLSYMPINITEKMHFTWLQCKCVGQLTTNVHRECVLVCLWSVQNALLAWNWPIWETFISNPPANIEWLEQLSSRIELLVVPHTNNF